MSQLETNPELSRRFFLQLGSAALMITGIGANAQPSPGLPGEATRSAGTATPESDYSFIGGFPSAETVKRAYDDADLNRAIQAYRFFYPSVSMAGLFNGFVASGVAIDNKTFFILEGKPNQVLYTPNSDTPYAALPLDLTAGPITVELPPGPLIGVANDLNFRWVIDMGLPGPDAGKGGKHIILPRIPRLPATARPLAISRCHKAGATAFVPDNKACFARIADAGTGQSPAESNRDIQNKGLHERPSSIRSFTLMSSTRRARRGLTGGNGQSSIALIFRVPAESPERILVRESLDQP